MPSVRTLYWPDDYDAILDHLRRCYGPDEYEMLAAAYGDAPTFDPANSFVIEGEDGAIAAHVMIVPRQFQIGPSALPTAEISLLSVLPSHQGRGYEGLLMEAVHQRMTEQEYALGLSFGDPLLFESWQYEYAVGLYLTSYESEIPIEHALKAGMWDRQHAYERRTADWLGTRNRELVVRRFYSSDLPAVMALYADASMKGHYALAREEDLWTWQIEYLMRVGRSEADDFLVVEADDQLAAYARLVTQGTVNVFAGNGSARLSVIEAAGDHPDAIEALLSTIARTAQAFNLDRIGLFVHPQSAFMQHALARGAYLRHFTGAGLVRLHNLPLAMYLLEPVLEARRLDSRFASRAYRLVITTEQDETDVYLGMGEPEIVELEVPSTSLVRLMTGWYGIENVSMGYPERHTDLLRVLFPRRDLKIGLADLL